jgi:DNA-binding winged helix-turn-helix (wHTH) protein/tetratricopeptide (TPR) repeat protein
MHKQARCLYECGPFLLDPDNQVLTRNGEPVPLPPKAFETLLLLIEERGRLLEKERLLRTVWPDTFVEENNLTQYVSLLRKVLGDNAGDQLYIETVPKRGYRFVAPVREVVRNDRGLTLTRHLRARIVVRQEEEEISEADEVVSQSEMKSGPVRAVVHGSVIGKLAMAAAMIVVIGLVFYWNFNRRQEAKTVAAEPIHPRRSVAVLGFKNLSGNTSGDWISVALAEMFTTELSASESLRMVSGEDVARLKTDLRLTDSETLSKASLTQIRKNLGADITISGSYVELEPGSAGPIRLDIRLQDAAAGETVGSIAETGTETDLFQMVARAGAKLRAKLGEPEPSDTEQAELRAALPATPEAERLFSQGLAKLRAFDAPAAQLLLSKAVVADPQYALAHSALAAAWSALGYDEKAKFEAKKALELSDNLSRPEHLLISGRYWEITHDWDKAVETYHLLVSFLPDNPEYGLRLANSQTSAGRGKEALNTIATLRKQAPPLSADPQIDLAEATANESLGDFKQESRASSAAARKGDILGEHLVVARALMKQSWALSRLGEPGQAIAILQRAQGLFDAAGDRQGVASALHGIATVLQTEGNYAEAMHKDQQALSAFERSGDSRGMASTLNGMAIIHYEQGQMREAKALFERVLRIQTEVGSKINTAGALGNIANVLDAEGNLKEAQEFTEESVGAFREVGDQRALGTALGNLAVLRYERGDLQGAAATYEDALKIKREIGYQRGMAYDLSGLGRVLRAEGDAQNAHSKEEEALAIRNKIGEKINAASTLVDLAQLALDDGDPAQAEALASQAAQAFENNHTPADEALARIVMARSFLAQNKVAEARAALARAVAVAHDNPNRPLRFEFVLASAYERVDAAKRSPDFSATEVKRTLALALTEAIQCGYMEYELRIRLALGDIELKHGNAATARAGLQALSKDARAHGFALLARNAAILARGPT